MNIAITIIAYNRVDSLQRVLSSVERAYYDQPVTLIISIDKSKTTAVEEYADKYNWPHGEKKVIKHAENLGLRRHVLECGDRVSEYDAMVVLEDDITVAESFFIYVTQCVQKFKDDDTIAGISLYNFPINYHNQYPFHPLQTDSDVYLMTCAQSWGQVWMPSQWAAFRKWYESHNEEFSIQPHLPYSICSWPKSSWLKYHTRYCIEQHKYFVYPYMALCTNNSDAGTHVSKKNTQFQAFQLYGLKEQFNINPSILYDGFFECENLYDVLELNTNNLCIDILGIKNNAEKKRYWLTRKYCNYKIIRSFSLDLKPYELNFFFNKEGSDIFLYDTRIQENNKLYKNRFSDFFYFYQLYNFKDLIKKIFNINT